MSNVHSWRSVETKASELRGWTFDQIVEQILTLEAELDDANERVERLTEELADAQVAQ